jgi:hypothetical protein
MMKMMQNRTGDEAKNEPESRLEHCFETGRHKSNDVTGVMFKPQPAAI